MHDAQLNTPIKRQIKRGAIKLINVLTAIGGSLGGGGSVEEDLFIDSYIEVQIEDKRM